MDYAYPAARPDRQAKRIDYGYMLLAIVPVAVIYGAMITLIPPALSYDYTQHTLFALQMTAEGQTDLSHFLYQLMVISVAPLLPNIVYAAWFVVMFFSVLTVPIVYRMIQQAYPAHGRFAVITPLLTVGLLIAGPILLIDPGEGNTYFSYVWINVYHNPTILVLKPLALLVFLRVAPALISPPSISPQAWLTTTALVVLCLLAKPNYLMSLVPALVLVVGWRLWRRQPVNVPLLGLGIILPTVAILGVQYLLTFGTSEDGIAIAPFAMLRGHEWTEVPVLALALVLSMLFPLAVLAGYWQDARRDSVLGLCWLAFAAGLAQMYLLVETGSRAAHGNFLWGGQTTLFVLFVYSAVFYMRHWQPEKRRYNLLIYTTAGLHVAFGVILCLMFVGYNPP